MKKFFLLVVLFAILAMVKPAKADGIIVTNGNLTEQSQTAEPGIIVTNSFGIIVTNLFGIIVTNSYNPAAGIIVTNAASAGIIVTN